MRTWLTVSLGVISWIVAAGSAHSDDVDAYIQDTMQLYHIPGVSACVVRNGEIIWTGAYGLAHIAEDRAVSESTLFMLASISKTVTMTGLMQLWEEGYFALDDDVNAHLPFELRIPNHPDEPITFRQVLSHTASLRDNWNVGWATYVQGDTPWALADYAYAYFHPDGVYYDAALNFHSSAPGTLYDYCNHGFVLAGYLVETISGMPFAEYCQESLFEPLGMDEASWFIRDLDPDHVAMPYDYSGTHYVEEGHYGYADYPAGTLRTSAPQLARLLIALGGHGSIGETSILDSATVDLITTVHYPHLKSNQGLAWYQGSTAGCSVWQHEGGDLGVRTIASYSFEEGLGVVVLTNRDSGTGLMRIRNHLFSTFLSLSPVLPAVERVDSAWREGRIEVSWELRGADGELSFDVTRFAVSGGSIREVPDATVIRRGDVFTYTDARAVPGETYRYRIVIRLSGDEVATFETMVDGVRARFSFDRGSASLCTGEAGVGFSLDRPGPVDLGVFEISGRRIATLLGGMQSAGDHWIRWGGRGVAGGVYFYRLKDRSRIRVRRIVVAR